MKGQLETLLVELTRRRRLKLGHVYVRLSPAGEVSGRQIRSGGNIGNSRPAGSKREQGPGECC